MAKRELRFQVAWINAPDFPRDVLHSIELSLIGKRGLLDPRLGGPCYYKEIAYIRIPKSYRIAKAMRGEVYGYQVREQEVEGLLVELHGLGQLPLANTDDYVEIRGYI